MSNGPALGESSATASVIDELLAVGKVAADPIELKVSIRGPKGAFPKSGEKSAISFRTKKKAYVIVVAVSAEGSVDVLFPNGSHPKTTVSSETDYMLAGTGSDIRAVSSTKPDAARIVFYVSGRPVTFPRERIPAGKGWLTISSKDSARIKELSDTLKSMSSAPGFNRIALPIRVRLVDCLTEPCGNGRARPKGFRLMGRPDSDNPIGVTGGQGRSDSTKRKSTGQ
jgi:hypothetical protein